MFVAANDSHSGIAKKSANLATMFSWVFWLTAFWLFANVSYVPLKRFGAALVTPETDALQAAMAFADLLFAQLPVILAMAAVYTAKKLFVQFSQGEIFTARNGATLMRVGDWLIASAVVALIMPIIDADRAGTENIDFSGSYFAVVIVLIGFAIRLFGRTFTIAADIKADNDQMV
jgi:Protein of unknown function (DUF2975)